MKKLFYVLLLALIPSLLAAAPHSQILQRYQTDETDVYTINHESAVTDQANVWLGISNMGMLGRYGEDYTSTNPECEFPAGSGVQYLFSGAVWIGALIDQGDSTFARVSVGTEGWTGPSNSEYELHPGELGGLPVQDHGILERSNIPYAVNDQGEPIYSPDALSHREYVAVYTDTLTEQFWTGHDIVDGLHFPLNVRVTQKVMTWSAPDYSDFVILEFTLENLGGLDLRNLYLGFYMDHDVGWVGEGIWYTDDVTGFLQSYNNETLNIAYCADNDGRPVGVNSGNDFTAPGVCGMYPLSSIDTPYYISYNWWFSNGNPNVDYGPAWIDDGAIGGWTQTYGTPDGDEHKYFIMSNHEIDFDQWYLWDTSWIETNPQSFTNPFTGEISSHNWQTSIPFNAEDMANGYDTRYLVSFGPIGFNVSPPGEEPETYLAPSGEYTFTVALLCGDNFHDVDHPQGNVSTGHIDPEIYNYDDFYSNSQRVKWLFENNYPQIIPYPPGDFQVIGSPDEAIELAWTPCEIENTGLYIYRRTEGGEYGDPLNAQPLTGTTYTDTDVVTGQVYYYKALTILGDSTLSAFTDELGFPAGSPLAPASMSADSSDAGVIYLSWEANMEPDLDYYNLYRREAGEVWALFDMIPAGQNTYDDNTVTNGVRYYYRVTAVDNDAIESFPSNTVSKIAMGFDQHLLIVKHYGTGPIYEWSPASLDDYYEQLFTDIGEDPDYMTVNSDTPQFPSLQELSPYQIVWIVDDDRYQEGYTYMADKLETLQSYIYNGGKVIYSGRRLFSGSFGQPTSTYVTPLLSDSNIDQWLITNLQLEAIFASNRLSAQQYPEFIQAASEAPEFPDLYVDTNRVAELNDPIYPHDYLMEVDGMEASSEAEVFYSFVSGLPDSSLLNGMAVGVRYLSPIYANTMITFPLYAMQPYEEVMDLARQLLDDIDVGVETGASPPEGIPRKIALKPNYPNPFNAQTTFEFELPGRQHVVLNLYNIQGQLVDRLVDASFEAGRHQVTYNANQLSSGIYFARMQVDGALLTRKVVLLK